MQTQTINKNLLDPYRTIGGFVSGKLSLSQSSPTALTAPTNCSFKVYSENLSIKVASPTFSSPIVAAISFNEYTYIRISGKVLKLRFHHVVREWLVSGGEKACFLLKFEGILILGEGDRLTLIDEQTNEIQQKPLPFQILGIVHPVTYVNKIVAFSKQSLCLVNVLTGKILYSFPLLISNIIQNNLSIRVVEPSPLIDIIAIGFHNGTISFLNLRKDQTVFSIKQKQSVSALAFSHERSWLASSDCQGNVLLWDLQEKRILYKFQNCLTAEIDSLLFLPGLPVLTCASSAANCIRQLRIDIDDSKIMTLYRQRLGTWEHLEQGRVASNNQLVFSTASQTMFVSFHSQCNSYLLPRVLDSKLPYHLIARNFNIQLYKGNSLEKSFQLHEYATTAKISLSNKYYIVATKRRMIKLGLSSPIQWMISNVRFILLFNQHYIFAFTHNQLVVCDFISDSIVQRISVEGTSPAANLCNTLMTFYNLGDQQIEVWDMGKLSQGRRFRCSSEAIALSFTTDNRFLVSSHKNGKLNIWSIVDDELYKSYDLGGEEMIWHCFTPDNQFMVSIFRGKREANVWNNYLGRITSSRQEEILLFQPEIRHLCEDYRGQLNKKIPIQLQLEESTEENIFDEIEDANDDVADYSFHNINKWMPLVYYDEIRLRNAPKGKEELPAMPFFLDFKNLTEEKKKIETQIQQQIKEKRKAFQSQKDKHFKADNRQLQLDENSSAADHFAVFQSICQLSVAEIDYRLRGFLLNPSNKPHLLAMMVSVLSNRSPGIPEELKNIVLHRILALIGSQLLQENLAKNCESLLTLLTPSQQGLKQRIDHCLAIAGHQ